MKKTERQGAFIGAAQKVAHANRLSLLRRKSFVGGFWERTTWTEWSRWRAFMAKQIYTHFPRCWCFYSQPSEILICFHKVCNLERSWICCRAARRVFLCVCVNCGDDDVAPEDDSSRLIIHPQK
jgi:hypothetical protein